MQFKSKPFYKMYVHPKKAFRAYMASSSNSAYYNDFSKIHVTHEVLNMLDYDGKPCIEDIVTNYNFYHCYFIVLITVIHINSLILSQ